MKDFGVEIHNFDILGVKFFLSIFGFWQILLVFKPRNEYHLLFCVFGPWVVFGSFVWTQFFSVIFLFGGWGEGVLTHVCLEISRGRAGEGGRSLTLYQLFLDNLKILTILFSIQNGN